VSGARVVALVAEREIRERFRGRAFRASTVVLLLAVLGIVVFVAVQGDDAPDHATVVLTGPTATELGRAIRDRQDAFGLRLETRRVSSAAAGRQAVSDGDADASLTAGGTIAVAHDAPDALLPLLQAAWREASARAALRARGLSADEARAALAPPPLRVVRIGEDTGEGQALAFIGTLLLYVGILSFGYYVASGVVEEKGTRVVEIVLSAVRPAQLLAGKVIGIGLLGLAQLVAIAGVGIGVALALGSVDLPAATAETVLVSAVYFVLGYTFYACGFAAAGAIVSRQEDIQSTTAPLAVALVISYLAALSVLGNPDSTLAQVTTFLPPVAPLVVPARAAQDALSLGELVLSLAAMALGIALLLVVGARIYERTILRLGSPLTLAQALRLARSANG
jgi:ABC-2 type transport system permease protein